MNQAEQYFLEIVRCGGLSKAAGKLYISQPSLTKYVQRLEKRIGTKLFDRSVSPMRLSDAGQLYYAHLLETEARERTLLAKLTQIANTERGTLRLGMPSFFGQCYLPELLERFRARYPHVEVELLEASGEQLERALLEQRIDLSLLHLPVTHPELCYETLFSERILLAVPSEETAPFQVRETAPPALEELCFILPLSEQKLGKFTARLFAERDLRPQVFLHTQNVTTMLSLAARGMGAAFVPEGGLSSISRTILEKLRFYHLPGLEMTVAALYRKDGLLPPYGRYLIELLK